jgi:hypothetical protein
LKFPSIDYSIDHNLDIHKGIQLLAYSY